MSTVFRLLESFDHERGFPKNNYYPPEIVSSQQTTEGMQPMVRHKRDDRVTCLRRLHIKEFGLNHKNPKRFVTLEVSLNELLQGGVVCP